MRSPEQPPIAPSSKWAIGSGVLASVLISISAICYLLWLELGPTPPASNPTVTREMTYFLIITAWSGMLLALFFRLALVWIKLSEALEAKHQSLIGASQNTAHKQALDKGFKEHFLYLFSGLITLCTVAFLSSGGIHPFSAIQIANSGIGVSQLHVGLFLGAFFSLFSPLLLGNILYARKESGLLGRDVIVKDAVSKSSFYVTCLIGGLLGVLAWQAGKNNFNLDNNFGIYVTLIVILVFLAFVIAPHIARLWNNREDIDDHSQDLGVASGGFALSEKYPSLISLVDSLLVRIVAPLTGATQEGAFFPHLLILMLIIPLSALGFILSSPYGLVPIGLAMLMIYALGRRWAWVENDRETASRVQSTQLSNTDIRIGFDNDLKDEALLGYAALFFLVPLALFQIDGFVPTFSEESNKFQDWLRFFGAELAKAVPFVDWWEIYKVDVKSPMQINDDTPALAKHLTFGARAMVDLVIMAALLQAIGIWQRGRAQYRLYKAGQVNAFDPFLEESFFKKGMFKKSGRYIPKQSFEDRLEEHAATRQNLGFPKIAYNERRLGELIHHTDEEVRAGAEWIIEHFPVLVGTPRDKIEQIANQWLNDAEQTHIDKNDPIPEERRAAMIASSDWRRTQRMRAEALLEELIDRENEVEPKKLTNTHIPQLMRLVSYFETHDEFHFSKTLITELLSQTQCEASFWALIAQVWPDRASGDQEKLREADLLLTMEVEEQLNQFDFQEIDSAALDFRHGKQEVRALCYHAIVGVSQSFDSNTPLPHRMVAVLRHMETVETGKEAKAALEEAIESIEATL